MVSWPNHEGGWSLILGNHECKGCALLYTRLASCRERRGRHRLGGRRCYLREGEVRLRANMTILKPFKPVNIFKRAVNANICFWQRRVYLREPMQAKEGS